MRLPEGPLVAWYGDDFTGSAAVMEVLALAGVPAVLFFKPPDAAALSRFGPLGAIGVAGDARSRSPEWMDAHLPAIFEALRQTGAPLIHYKVCSTFDSAPHVGSIGRAADIGLAGGGWAPLVLGAPEIGRYQAFGTLFAAAGDEVHRLDRHPTMATHPVTPMDEADVRRHLSRQTAKEIGLVDLRRLKAGEGAAALEAERAAGNTIVAFDVVDEETLCAAGEAIWRQSLEAPVFALGSQGVEYALIAAWRKAGIAPEAPRSAVVPASRVAVVSGSCSPITAEQIRLAEAKGFATIPLDATTALDKGAFARARQDAVSTALSALSKGRDPLIYTARGPHDPAVARFGEAVAAAGVDSGEVNRRIGEGLGEVLSAVVRTGRLRRAAIAGGDTSSHAAQALGLDAVTAKAPLVPGAALLTGHGEDPATDGLEIVLKGGQMGPPDFFERLRAGGPGRSL